MILQKKIYLQSALVGSTGSTSDFYSRGSRFESRPGHGLSQLKCSLLYGLQLNIQYYAIVRRYTIRVSDTIVEYATKLTFYESDDITGAHIINPNVSAMLGNSAENHFP
jgi:hypothetical protein